MNTIYKKKPLSVMTCTSYCLKSDRGATVMRTRIWLTFIFKNVCVARTRSHSTR